jgi:hypothetical protein
MSGRPPASPGGGAGREHGAAAAQHGSQPPPGDDRFTLDDAWVSSWWQCSLYNSPKPCMCACVPAVELLCQAALCAHLMTRLLLEQQQTARHTYMLAGVLLLLLLVVHDLTCACPCVCAGPAG